MNCKVFVLALTVLISISCNHKKDADNKPATPETPQLPTTHPASAHHHHGSDEDDDDNGHHGKHHRLPPGQEKKLHGAQSARDYAPGHRDQ